MVDCALPSRRVQLCPHETPSRWTHLQDCQLGATRIHEWQSVCAFEAKVKRGLASHCVDPPMRQVQRNQSHPWVTGRTVIRQLSTQEHKVLGVDSHVVLSKKDAVTTGKNTCLLVKQVRWREVTIKGRRRLPQSEFCCHHMERTYRSHSTL